MTILDLIDLAHLPLAFLVPVRVGKPSPVASVSRIEVAFRIGPGIPDLGVFAQIADVVFARKIPEQLAQHGRPVHFLRREQRKALGQVNGVMRAEIGNGVDTGPALLELAVIENKPDQIQIFFHVNKMPRAAAD